MASTSTQQLRQSGDAVARTAVYALFLITLAALALSWRSEFNVLRQTSAELASSAADKLQALYLQSSSPVADELLKKRVRDFHQRLSADGYIVHFVVTNTAGDTLMRLSGSDSYPGLLPQRHSAPLLAPSGTSSGRVLASVSADEAIRSLAFRSALMLALALALLFFTLRRLNRYRRAMESGTAEILKAFQRFEQVDYRDSLQSIGPLELIELQSATNHLGRSLANARRQLDQQVEQASNEVAQTLEEMEIKNVELDLARRRAVDDNLAKSSFLANISHEIRTPMNGIIGHLQLLQNSVSNPQHASYLSRTLQAANALLDIIDDTLNLSRIEANKLDLQSLPFNVLEEVNRCIVMQVPSAVAKNLDLYLFCDPDFPLTLIGDSLRVRQVVTNLVSNAIKYTEAGSVRVSLKGRRKPGNKYEVVLKVTDTGLGMDSAQIDSLFEAFSQAGRSPESGTGLGLLITRSLTEAMGGTLDLVSAINEGSTFTITLPLSRPDNASVAVSRAVSGTVHVEGDDPKAVSYFEALLRASGAHVVDAVNAETDLEVILVDRPQLNNLEREHLDMVEVCAARGLPHVALISTDNVGLLNRISALSRCQALPLHSPPADVVDAVQALLTHQPSLDRHEVTALPVAPDSALKLSGVRVLLADDDNFGRAYMQDLLRSHGATVDSCADGARAAEHAAQSDYDLILLDIRMPGCNGIEATQRIRRHPGNQHVPIIGMTASVVPEQHIQCMQAGMTDYWVKPLKMAQLLGGLEHWLIRRGEAADVPDSPSDALDHRPELAIDAALQELDDEMRDLLITEVDVYSARLKDLRAAGTDPQHRQDFAHKLAGTASICRLMDLKRAARQLESTSLNRDQAHLPVALDEVSEALSAVRTRLRQMTL